MYIIYDDINEFATVAIQCADMFRNDKCVNCPYVDVCGALIDKDLTNAIVRCGGIGYRKENGNG